MNKNNIVIGVDFDNTIVCYHDVFHKVAVDRKLIHPNFPKDKEKIRNYLRKINQEDAWTEMQGVVYGKEMAFAKAFSGVAIFFKAMRKNNIKTIIISHKTKFPYLGEKVDLHKAASKWLDQINLGENEIYFLETKKEKCEKIVECGCTHFIDDLPELLSDPFFPGHVHKILFSENQKSDRHHFTTFSHWNEIRKHFLCEIV
ncbi:MAG: hypothetical protein ACD_29C00463G0010 [uncultured bacterium]|nr:MAG: hypothetical protein ACD_29C00463G0010 [uncultured bacterium]